MRWLIRVLERMPSYLVWRLIVGFLALFWGTLLILNLYIFGAFD